MAITYSTRVICKDDTFEYAQVNRQSLTRTQTLSICSQFEISVGTSEETIDFGDVTPGLVILENRDDTNFIKIGHTTGQLLGTISADGIPVSYDFTNGTATLIVQADTAPCKLLVTAYGI